MLNHIELHDSGVDIPRNWSGTQDTGDTLMFFRKAIAILFATLPIASVSFAGFHTVNSKGEVEDVLYPLVYCELGQSYVYVLNDSAPISNAGTNAPHIGDGGHIFTPLTRGGMRFWLQFDGAEPIPLVRLTGGQGLLDRNTGNFAVKLENGPIYRLEIPSWRKIQLTRRLNGLIQEVGRCRPGHHTGK